METLPDRPKLYQDDNDVDLNDSIDIPYDNVDGVADTELQNDTDLNGSIDDAENGILNTDPNAFQQSPSTTQLLADALPEIPIVTSSETIIITSPPPAPEKGVTAWLNHVNTKRRKVAVLSSLKRALMNSSAS